MNKARTEEPEIIRCAGCSRRGKNAGYIMLSPEGETWQKVGPLCFECMDWTRRQMQRTARPDRVDEVRLMGREA